MKRIQVWNASEAKPTRRVSNILMATLRTPASLKRMKKSPTWASMVMKNIPVGRAKCREITSQTCPTWRSGWLPIVTRMAL